MNTLLRSHFYNLMNTSVILYEVTIPVKLSHKLLLKLKGLLYEILTSFLILN